MTHDAHVDFDMLSDFADESLSAFDHTRVRAHLAACPDCAARLATLRRLLGAASALPADVEPPLDLWSDIHARIAPTGATADTGRRGGPPNSDASNRVAHWLVRRPWLLAAAAVVLVVVSSAITAAIVRRTPNVVATRQTAAIAAPPALPAAARAIDADYARTVSELADALASHRTVLDPATIAKVEASLHVIDTAIAEAREALARDPANLALLDILSANYERKLELLRRASELPSST